jgi:hypothetical protein
MDFTEETEEKKINIGKVLGTVANVVTHVAPFVPALQPVAGVIAAVKK